MRAVLQASSVVASRYPHLELHGNLGSYIKYGLDPQEAALKAGVSPIADGFGMESADSFGVLTDAAGVSTNIPSPAGDYRSFYTAMAHAVRHRASVRDGGVGPVSGEEATTVIKLIEIAKASSDSGRRIVI